MGLIIFPVALGVRVLHWQDNHALQIKGDAEPVIMDSQYKIEVRRMRREGGLLFPREHIDADDAQMLLHPPGYPILVATMYRGSLTGHLFEELRWLQIIVDAMAAVILFLIAVELLPVAVAFIAGLIAALSPHFSYYSLSGTPDTLAVAPVLLSVYLFIRAMKRPRLITVLAAGAMIGVSCWLRANALLLAPAMAAAVWLVFERGGRLRYALALVSAALIVIAPITIRNWVVFNAFVPLSLGSGIILVQGIDNYDHDDRFGMPGSHREVLQKDVEWHGRPEYGRKVWKPDGIARDRARFSRGVAVIADNPSWFFGVMLRRAASMLYYNSSPPGHWPENTSTVPIVSPQPPFNHPQIIPNAAEPEWYASAGELIERGEKISSLAEVSLSADGQTMNITGDGSGYADQFASSPIKVKKDTDYLFVVPLKVEQGVMAAKVTSEDRRVTLGSAIAKLTDGEAAQEEGDDDEADAEELTPATTYGQQSGEFRIAFATGGRDSVRLVLSNDGAASPSGQVGSVQLFTLGPTPQAWTRYPRALVRAIQRNLYSTATMLPLIVVGIVLLALAGRRKTLLALLAVPVYYLATQSVLHTEYRYILAIHYFLFIMAATTFYVAGAAIKLAGRKSYQWLNQKRLNKAA